MSTIIEFILKTQPKYRKSPAGFTLIEVLVAMILAILVIGPLLAFMISFLDSDHREQAKSTSEQEIQTALDYITKDLQQAIYIYDANGVERNSNTTPANSGIKDQIPPVAGTTGCDNTITTYTCTPVIVFWKRAFLGKDDIISGTRIGNITSVTGSTTSGTGNDASVYSLVAYYLIKYNSCNVNNTWSCTARIGRFEIRGGVFPSNNTITTSSRVEGQNADGTNITINYGLLPSSGFLPFNLSLVGDLPTRMNQWKKLSSENYNTPIQILVDYIDQSATSTFFPQTCATSIASAQVPSTLTGGFYTCVNSTDLSNPTIQVFIRGNALARISDPNNPPGYNEQKSTFFPTATTLVKGRGFIGIQ